MSDTKKPRTDSADWSRLTNEASVELRVVLPMLAVMGYDLEDIGAKVPLTFQQGRTGRKHEADFIVYSGPVHTPNTSLMVIEAKAETESLNEAKTQAESYAFASRAPFALLCNGLRVQLWRINLAFESECLIDCAQEEFMARKGEFDLLVSKRAAEAYARERLGKATTRPLADFNDYEDHELQRTADTDPLVDRRLKDGLDVVAAETFLQARPRGAVIIAGSGLGKTTLCLGLHRQALKDRWATDPYPLSVHVILTDCPPEQTLLVFCRGRIEAHRPGFTDDAMAALLRQNGLLLICDGFDRLSSADQTRRERELRALLRDFPKLQLIVTSRPLTAPDLSLPTVALAPLNEGERDAIMRRRLKRQTLRRPPPFLWKLCETPLILSRVLESWPAQGTYPTNVADLFQQWLDTVVRHNPRELSVYADRVRALTKLATIAEGGRVPVDTALAGLAEIGLPTVFVDALTTHGVLDIDQTGSLVFEHEALVDYLKARDWIAQSPAILNDRIATADFEAGSFLPVLLMAMIADPATRAHLWSKLATGDFGIYVDALLYEKRLSLAAGSQDQPNTERVLADILSGVAHPLEAFFPALRTGVQVQLTGVATPKGLSLVGNAGEGWIDYAYLPTPKPVEIRTADTPEAVIERGLRLRDNDLSLFNGRALGMHDLLKSMLEMIDTRDLPGGPLWRRERLRGRLMEVGRILRPQLDEYTPLAQWVRVLKSIPNHVFRLSRRNITSASLLNEVEAVRADGLKVFSLDALTPGWARRAGGSDLSDALALHYDLTQALYRELVETCFKKVASGFGLYVNLPVRWEIYWEDASRWISYRWKPVGTWKDSSTILHRGWPTSQHPREWADAVRADLQRLKRFSPSSMIETGQRSIEGLERSDFERSPLAAALETLRKDVERLFKDVPAEH